MERNKNVEWKRKLLFSDHHTSHAASAFFPSPFDEAVVLIMDGVGEWSTTTVAIGNSNKIDIVKELISQFIGPFVLSFHAIHRFQG